MVKKKKPVIKIFVSHRIDLDSEIINNDIFVPVRCGAVFDKRKNKPNVIGDDTGDNISEKRLSYNELTVQYWAWKNVKADYYGLCHYRRYLSFDDKNYNENGNFYRFAMEDYLAPYAIKKHRLDNFNYCADLIRQNDIVVPLTIDITKIPTKNGFGKNVIEHWKKTELIDIKYVRVMQTLVEKQYPEYKETFKKYLNGKQYRAHNIFVMRRDYFNELCTFQFDILRQMEKKIDTTNYNQVKSRIIGFLGEILEDLFIWHQEWVNKVRIKELQVIFFSNSKRQKIIQKKGFPICISCSDKYVPYLYCTLVSILQKANNESNYNFIILTNSISKDNQVKLINLIKTSGKKASIQFYNPDFLISDERFLKGNIDNRAKQFYLYVPWVLKRYDKALILEVDMIIEDDLVKLFNEKIDNYYLAGVQDIVHMGCLNSDSELLEYTKTKLKMSDPYKYINSGLLLLNTKKIRMDFTLDGILRQEIAYKFRVPVQDLVNLLFKDKIKFLNLRWNYFVKTNNWVEEMIACAPVSGSERYNDLQSPAVIHWVNKPKPWNNPTIPFAYKFWRVARNTDFYEEILTSMNKNQIDTLIQSGDIVYYMPFNKMFLKSIKKIIDRLATPIFPKDSKRRIFISRNYRKLLKLLKIKK